MNVKHATVSFLQVLQQSKHQVSNTMTNFRLMWQKTEHMKDISTSVELCSKAGNSVGLSLIP
jgi:hypothetical protein